MSDHSVILFDGECSLCHRSVQFIIPRDPQKRFRFGSLQSAIGRQLIKEYSLPDDLSTIVLIENGTAHLRSSAALRIARHLNRGWPLLYGFIFLPAFVRDPLYRLIAHKRYQWFGKLDACPLPDPDQADRFID